MHWKQCHHHISDMQFPHLEITLLRPHLLFTATYVLKEPQMFDAHTTDCCRGKIRCTNPSHRCHVCVRSFARASKTVAVQRDASNATREYLNVSYADKNTAKSLGAWWDSDKKQWYVGPRATTEQVATLRRLYAVKQQHTQMIAEKVTSVKSAPDTDRWGDNSEYTTPPARTVSIPAVVSPPATPSQEVADVSFQDLIQRNVSLSSHHTTFQDSAFQTVTISRTETNAKSA